MSVGYPFCFAFTIHCCCCSLFILVQLHIPFDECVFYYSSLFDFTSCTDSGIYACAHTHTHMNSYRTRCVFCACPFFPLFIVRCLNFLCLRTHTHTNRPSLSSLFQKYSHKYTCIENTCACTTHTQTIANGSVLGSFFPLLRSYR